MADTARRGPPPTDIGGFSIHLGQPKLHRVRFAVADDLVEASGIQDKKKEQKVDVNFGLTLARPSMNEIGTELAVTFRDNEYPDIEVAYRIEARVDLNEDSTVELEEALKTVAAQISPAALYPYIRETLGSLSTRAGATPIVLPVVNFRRVFDLDAITIPKVLDAEGRDSSPVGSK